MPITDASSEDEDSTTESAERLSKCAQDPCYLLYSPGHMTFWRGGLLEMNYSSWFQCDSSVHL